MNNWDAKSSYTVLMTDGRQSVFVQTSIPWKPSTLSHTADPRLGAEEISFQELWGVSKPFLMLAAGWGIGLATGALGLVWLLR